MDGHNEDCLIGQWDQCGGGHRSGRQGCTCGALRREAALVLLSACLNQSDDPDTQTACVIDYGTGFAVSSNQLPTGVIPTPARVARPAKYRFVMHAERRAIAIAAANDGHLKGSIAYSNWFPCSECASSLIQAGIVRLVCNRNAYEARVNDPAYAFAESMEMLLESGVEIDWI